MRRKTAKKAALKIKKQEQISEQVHLEVDLDNYSFRVCGETEQIYIPTGSLLDCHKSKKDGTLVIGPFGSGKSTYCLAEILFYAVQMPPMRDNVLRSKWAIVRNTLGELETTTLRSWLMWFSELGEMKKTHKPVLSVTHTFNMIVKKNGVTNQDVMHVEMELLFLGLDREADKQKLDSVELTGAYANECRHINEEIYFYLFDRSSRFPAQKDLDFSQTSALIKEEYDKKGKLRKSVKKLVVADTNPPDTDHWIYRKLEEKDNEMIYLHHQPPGLIKDEAGKWITNEEMDNEKNISISYYTSSAAARNWDEEYIKVYCLGLYGILKTGVPVLHEYNDMLHSSDHVDLLPHGDIILAWDFGVTPCCLVVQVSPLSQLRCIKEFVTERSSTKSLAENFVNPWIEENLKGYAFKSVGDPANPTAQTDLKSCFNVLAEVGIPTVPAVTNSIEARLNAVKEHLNTNVEGLPKLLISRKACPILRKAILTKYQYEKVRIIGEERYKDTPVKNHPWSDISDCLQYSCLENVRIEKRKTSEAGNWSRFNKVMNFN